jgi:beta-lactamase superfamily II metal-dependent hydrolase
MILLLTGCSGAVSGKRTVDPEALFSSTIEEGLLRVQFFHLYLEGEGTEQSGESILIVTPEGKTILIDAGKPQFGALIDDYLNQLGIEKIDLVMPSHPHIYHIGGLTTLLKTKEIGKIIQTDFPVDTAIYKEYVQVIEEEGIDVEYVEEGDRFDIEKDLSMEILNPPKDFSVAAIPIENLTAGIVNDYSMVIKMTYKDKVFLFTGDIYSGIEANLIDKYGEDLAADVVKVPHHGLGTSSSRDFIETINPDITFFPTNLLMDKTVYEDYREAGSEVFVSEYDGNIVLLTDGKNMDVITETERTEEVEAFLGK